MRSTLRPLVRRALAALGVERFVLAIHDVSFPSAADEDVGRGSPYSRGAEDFFAFLHALGFDGVQFGPQGETSPGNPSPYDGSVFSKSILSLALTDLTTPRYLGLLEPRALAAIVEEARARTTPGRADHVFAFDAQRAAVLRASQTLNERVRRHDDAARALKAKVEAFVSQEPFRVHDALFEALVCEHGTDDWRTWPAEDRTLGAERAPEVVKARAAMLLRRHADRVFAWNFGQYVLDEQHRRLRGRLAELSMSVYGDLQVGLSLRDTWSRGALFLEHHVMGAPPSRTNPDGQPWGYPVFDPRKYMERFHPPASGLDHDPRAFFAARVAKIFEEFDGLRIDHPHGVVCPWVYDRRAAEPMHAVRNGARLFESPADDAHPELAPYAIARVDQLARGLEPYADEWVRDLDASQVTAYAVFMSTIVHAAAARGRTSADVLCEVLSTCPAPLRDVMDRFGLGRFRVTQKASMGDPLDGYRSEHAQPSDWIMIGNHDTDPLLRVVARYRSSGTLRARAEYLATRLEPDERERVRFAGRLIEDPRWFVQAMFAELFTSRAKNVMIFFADLFGTDAVYNMPGVVHADNWTLRVPNDFRGALRRSLELGEALDVPAALAMAMRARGKDFTDAHRELCAALERASAS